MKVFYRPEMSLKLETFSPSPSKPAAVVKEYSKRFRDQIEVVSFEPLTIDDLKQAHSTAYVYGVMAGKMANGFGGYSLDAADSFLYTTGSIVAAARYAVLNQETVFSPTSGFHHAGYHQGGGFCTFNGLILSAIAAHDAGAKRVGIIDCDYHYGDGTDDILRRLDLPFIQHFTTGEVYTGKDEAERFLQLFPIIVREMAQECDLLIYQAGADCHVDDPLGGFLTSEQMQKRDEILFRIAANEQTPVAWNLAGGYQRPMHKILRLHNATMEEALKYNENQVTSRVA